jgi:hypothetical protein
MNIGWSFALRRLVPAALATFLGLYGQGWASPAGAAMSIASGAFSAGGTIPSVAAYTGCAADAANRSPELTWKGAPAGAKSFALALFDPDAPTGHGFVHWVLFDIPSSVTHLADNAGDPGSHADVPGAVFGRVDFGFSHYGGPCPPKGDKPHHYIFTLYALDVAKVAGADARTTAPQLEHAIDGHVLEKASLVGRFGR